MPPNSEPTVPTVDPVADELLEPGEATIVIVRRHIIGVIGLYLGVVVGILVIVGFFIMLSPSLISNLFSESSRALLGIIVLSITIMIFFLFVATYVYRQSRLIVASRSLIEVLQKGLFIRQVSRLSMSNVEDVTAQQNGILATFFNYGTLIVQTAGQMDNFIFPTCPDPNKYAHEILEARQAYAQSIEEANEHSVAMAMAAEQAAPASSPTPTPPAAVT